MAQVRFNHMELTVPRGSFDEGLRDDLKAFYGGALGWEMLDGWPYGEEVGYQRGLSLFVKR